MNIVIHTFSDAPEERRNNAEIIKTALGDNAYIYVGGTNTCENWVNILKEYSTESLLLLEDDIRLGDNFLDRVQEYINLYPDFVLNFYFNSGNTELPFLRDAVCFPTIKTNVFDRSRRE